MVNDYDGFFSRDVPAFLDTLAALDAKLGPNAEVQKDENFQLITNAFEQSCVACRRVENLLADEPEEMKEAKERFRAAVSPVTHQSWFIERAYTKPRGYPGDGELLTAIYDEVPRSRGLAGYMDLYFLNTTLACAIRERLRCAKNFLIEELDRRRGDVSILNVACGPVREYEGGIEHPADTRVHITCVDTDQETLNYVESRHAAGALGDLDVQCVNYNAIRTSSAQGNIRRFGQPQIIYSIGLCDYIPDKYLVPMLQGWRETVCDGGSIYVAFKDTRKYSETVYQWHVDWYFYLRTEDDFRNLFEQAGYDMYGLKMTRDLTGSIINFIGRKSKPIIIRIDRAESRVAEPAAASVARPRAKQLAADAVET
jgi:hypothetical protein